MALRTAGSKTRRSPSTTEPWWHRPDNVIIALTLVLTFAIAPLLHPPAKSPPLRIVNSSALTVTLEVQPRGRAGWMVLGTFPPGRTTVREVVDQGGTWAVRASAGPRHSPPFTIERRQLERQGWTLAIPDTVTESLRRSGAVPEP